MTLVMGTGVPTQDHPGGQRTILHSHGPCKLFPKWQSTALHPDPTVTESESYSSHLPSQQGHPWAKTPPRSPYPQVAIPPCIGSTPFLTLQHSGAQTFPW